LVTIRCSTKNQEHEYTIQRIDERNVEGTYSLTDHSGRSTANLMYGFRGGKFMLLSSSYTRQTFNGTFLPPPNDISEKVVSLLKVYCATVMNTVDVVEYMNAADIGVRFTKSS